MLVRLRARKANIGSKSCQKRAALERSLPLATTKPVVVKGASEIYAKKPYSRWCNEAI